MRSRRRRVASHASRYFAGYARDPLAREGARRHRRDRGLVRANMVEHWEERDLDDPRSIEYRILCRGGQWTYTSDPDLAVSLVRATR